MSTPLGDFCSVLNIVIDHSMERPTLMEPEENALAKKLSVTEHEKPEASTAGDGGPKLSAGKLSSAESDSPQALLVPVIRIFGPILRNDGQGLHAPQQSACLYIHGAFPYMLARPVVAGPDGSMRHALPATGSINWDDAESVTCITKGIAESLESSIQSFNMYGVDAENQRNGGSDQMQKTTAQKRAIRKISVVQGRGFYTYCLGPPAPFLRVEYYDPKIRWKVKLLLEQGLDVPISFHPDPVQYDRSEAHDSPDEPLKFHCYEAHIPYTMQFFKDYNLAGLSYIHIAKGKFRGVLPSDIRAARENGKEKSFDFDSTEDSYFLRSNTPREFLWKSAYEDGENLPQNSNRSNLNTEKGDGIPLCPLKQTSCDVEMDCTVGDILNIQSVITSMPGDQESRDRIQWRAVPSLQEIWRQERQRMSMLLPRDNDFLSHPNQESSLAKEKTDKKHLGDDVTPSQMSPPFTLNVKEGAPRPGALIAAQGMRRLVGVTKGLQQDFLRTMKDIIERHKTAIEAADRSLRERVRSVYMEGAESQSQTMTPSWKEVLNALETLAKNDRNNLEGCDDDLIDEISRHSVDGDTTQSPRKSFEASQPILWYHSTQQSVFESEDKGVFDRKSELLEYSQRVDRGEAVVDKTFIEDSINPETLLPYESVYFGADRCLTRFAVDSDPPGTFRICGAGLDSCKRNGHNDSSDRVRAGYYPTVTTGAFVDGFMYTASPDDYGYCSDEDEDRFEQKLSMLQTQMHPDESCRDSNPSEHVDELITEPTTPSRSALSLVTQPMGDSQTDDGASGSLDDSPKMGRREKIAGSLNNVPLDKNANAHLNGRREAQSLPVSPPIQWKSGMYVEYTSLPPSRREVHRQFLKRENRSKSRIENEKFAIAPNNRRRQGSDKTDHNERTRTLQVHSGCVGLESTEKERFSPSMSVSQSSGSALQGIGNQGGRIHVAGGGGLKAKTRVLQTGFHAELKQPVGEPKSDSMRFLPTPVSFMSVEVHVQCRSGCSRLDSLKIAMVPNSSKDKVYAVVFIFGVDPGGGEALQYRERGCLFVPLALENANRNLQIKRIQSSLPGSSMGISAPFLVECCNDERSLLLRFASIVRMKDPDMLVSWDTQSAGIGYLIERGVNLANDNSKEPTSSSQREIDMVRLLGRTPQDRQTNSVTINKPPFNEDGKDKSKLNGLAEGRHKWKGSGLGSDWDDRVGAGAAAASIVGRLVFAGWKLISEEVKNPNASYLPAVVSATLKKRIPHHDGLALTNWYANSCERWRVVHHRLEQAAATLHLFDALDTIGRAGEAARLSGVEFSQSFPGLRGSQYKVEGVLLRALQSLRSDERGSKKGIKNGYDREPIPPIGFPTLTHSSDESNMFSPWKERRARDSCDMPNDEYLPLNDRHYFFFSPSMKDIKQQEALEWQAMTMEPRSGFYKDPVVVCDFTALYPSLIIAYNLCYSTVCGKLEYHSTRREMQIGGRTTGNIGPFTYPETRTATVLAHHLKSVAPQGPSGGSDEYENTVNSDRVYVAPTGTLYVSENVLKGVLPQILDEMLSTRAMLKRAAKEYKKSVPNLSPAVLRQLEARQLALKYVANVTYGYTSATFSGRCALPLLADTIVDCGRKTLARTIEFVNRWGKENKKWLGCRVVYGDTDSVFVELPGRTVDEAFEFGGDLCRAITAMNPPPIELKFEKVYVGSILQTMKRYAGMKLEERNQKKPVFEAKGIETVRRDQCALTQNVLKNALTTLFKDGLDAVQGYLYRQWSLILSGKLPVSDFILTGRVRSRYSNDREGPVQAALARRLSEADPGRVVRHRERVPYVIVSTPGAQYRLKDCVLTPMELLERWNSYTVFSAYYISRHVNAALQRCFGLAPFNLDIPQMYKACPKPRQEIHFWPVGRCATMITTFFGSDTCSLCRTKCRVRGRDKVVVCDDCRRDHVRATVVAQARLGKLQQEAHQVARECSECNLCFEDSGTFAAVSTKEFAENQSRGGNNAPSELIMPLANCTNMDCPKTYQRHCLRSDEIEVVGACTSLGLM